MNVCLRVDGGRAVGLGHLSRCMALAQALRHECVAETTFLCNDDPVLRAKLKEAGLAAQVNDGDVSEEEFITSFLERQGSDLLVIDTKRTYGSQWVRDLRDRCPVVMMDNLCEGAFEADLAVFPAAHLPNYVLGDHRWTAAHARLLAGPEYVIIGRAIASLGRHHETHVTADDQPTVVLATGATDPDGVLLTLLEWCRDLALPGEVTALVGEGFIHQEELERLRLTLPNSVHVVPYAPERLASADLAVCLFGVAVYELLYLGVPTVTVAHTDENDLAGRVLAERYGATVHLGHIAGLTRGELGDTMLALSSDAGRRADMAKRGQHLIDGGGAQRVAREILQLLGVRSRG